MFTLTPYVFCHVPSRNCHDLLLSTKHTCNRSLFAFALQSSTTLPLPLLGCWCYLCYPHRFLGLRFTSYPCTHKHAHHPSFSVHSFFDLLFDIHNAAVISSTRTFPVYDAFVTLFPSLSMCYSSWCFSREPPLTSFTSFVDTSHRRLKRRPPSLLRSQTDLPRAFWLIHLCFDRF